MDRDEASVDAERINSWFTGKRALVSGAGGSIGSELCRQIAGFGPSELYLLDHDENGIFEVEQELKDNSKLKCQPVVADVRDLAKLRSVFKEYRPEVIFHAAAHKHVPMMEAYP
ncbi:MAG: polysaccharide biosynthesis protein [Armatimonadota bacterium]|nr:polysaccharide biosynthesis protein [Armatimonadota bacterium]